MRRWFRWLFRARRAVSRPVATRLGCEELESRTLLSTGAGGLVATPSLAVDPAYSSSQSPGGYQPAQIRHAYGFDQVTFNNGTVKGDGTGETIAIVDAYDDPNVFNDLDQFDRQFFGATTAPASSFLTKVNQNGVQGAYPGTDSSGGWELEESLDVEWARAIAPGAKIILLEANSPSSADLLTAVDTARTQYPNVVTVSMSWGAGEYSGETQFDNHFQTPAGHTGITFVASSGDGGAPAGWPASSPNVLAVGGTNLTLDGGDNRVSETGWSSSGGGYSSQYGEPWYQTQYGQSTYLRSLGNTVLLNGARGNPDVSYDANPSPGYAVYDSVPYQGYTGPWYRVGGTSAGAPQWAALIAIADQGRGPGNSLAGASQTLPALYQIGADGARYAADFWDVTSGSNGAGQNAGPGYDLVSGLGSPQANHLVADLVGAAFQAGPNGTTQVTFAGDPASGSASTPVSSPSPAPTPSSPAPQPTPTPTPAPPSVPQANWLQLQEAAYDALLVLDSILMNNPALASSGYNDFESMMAGVAPSVAYQLQAAFYQDFYGWWSYYG